MCSVIVFAVQEKGRRFVTLDDAERVSNGRRVWANSEQSLNLREGPCQLCACLRVRIRPRRRRGNRRPKQEDDDARQCEAVCAVVARSRGARVDNLQRDPLKSAID